MSDLPDLDPRAVALTMFRCMPDGTGREYTAATWAPDPWLGCSHIIRMARAVGYITASCGTACSCAAVLDVLSKDGEVIQDFCITTPKACRWFYRKLGLRLVTEATVLADWPRVKETI